MPLATTCNKHESDENATEPPTPELLRYKLQAVMLQVINSVPYKRKSVAVVASPSWLFFAFHRCGDTQELAATATKDQWQIIVDALTSDITFSALIEDIIGRNTKFEDSPLHLIATPIVHPKQSWLRYLGAFLSSQEHGPLRIKPWMDRHFVPLAEVGLAHIKLAVGSNVRSEKKRPRLSTDDWKASKRRALANVTNTPPVAALKPIAVFKALVVFNKPRVYSTNLGKDKAPERPVLLPWNENVDPGSSSSTVARLSIPTNVNARSSSSESARPGLSTNVNTRSLSSAIARPTPPVTFKPWYPYPSSSVPCTSWSFAHSKDDVLTNSHCTIIPLPRALDEVQEAAKTNQQKMQDALATVRAPVSIPRALDQDQEAATAKTQDSAPAPVGILRRTASDAALGESPTKRVTRLQASRVDDAVPAASVGAVIKVARPGTASPTKTYAGKGRSFAADPDTSPTRPQRGRKVSDSEDENDAKQRDPAPTPTRGRKKRKVVSEREDDIDSKQPVVDEPAPARTRSQRRKKVESEDEQPVMADPAPTPSRGRGFPQRNASPESEDKIDSKQPLVAAPASTPSRGRGRSGRNVSPEGEDKIDSKSLLVADPAPTPSRGRGRLRRKVSPEGEDENDSKQPLVADPAPTPTRGRKQRKVSPESEDEQPVVADLAPTPSRGRSRRKASPESEDPLNAWPEEFKSSAAPDTPSRTRSGKLRGPVPLNASPETLSITRSGKIRTTTSSGVKLRPAENLPTPSPSPSKRPTRSSPAKSSPTKLTPRKTASPTKRQLLKARTPSPVPDSEEESLEPLPAATSSQASSPIDDAMLPMEELDLLSSLTSRASSPIETMLPVDVEEPDLPASPVVQISTAHPSTNKLASISSQHCLNAQKREILRVIQNPPDVDDEDDDESTNQIALKQLSDLLQGTVVRGEGNSCLLLGPRGSGKTRIADQCIRSLPQQPIVLRLCGWSQQSDRLAMREIAYQLSQQTGKSFLAAADDDGVAGTEDADEEPNPFLETPNPVSMTLPSSTHLPALISLLPSLSRPTIILLDAFDLCQAKPGNKGITVIGMTTRVDTVNLLEKRVKSRFSGRTIRTGPPAQSRDWIALTGRILCSKIPNHEELEGVAEWRQQWDAGVESFLQDETTTSILKETFSVTKDVRVLARLLTSVVVQLTPSSPFPVSGQLKSAADVQRARPRFPMLHALPYPSICILIACVHAEAAGHPTFTFEMLRERVRDQIRISSSAPVEINGSSIGMPKCSRVVLMSAFESLVSARILAPTVAPSASVAKGFVRFRSVVSREDVKKAVQTRNDMNLSKWLKGPSQ
ncbi:AAA domain-containing protein [Mycena sanguinolenta]|uniref:AAA domain-containing protein n=1 Tax=Mycena sanguinolenta TaxID=230812 RepID=A0A8H6XPQ5_9AGAR|nr:AAA domain-containing protein [Mycena sanguinolenta]